MDPGDLIAAGVYFDAAEDFASASEALRQLFTRFKPKVPADWDQERICTCPKCHSEEIVFQELDAKTATFNWSCDACGHVWNDDGVERGE